jgi:hypothetical protein
MDAPVFIWKSEAFAETSVAGTSPAIATPIAKTLVNAHTFNKFFLLLFLISLFSSPESRVHSYDVVFTKESEIAVR